MKIKLLQLNMWAGTKISAIKEFLKGNDFDILCFQEAAGIQTYIGNIQCDIDCFTTLLDMLGSDFSGELAISHRYTSNPITSYLGNAIFYKKGFNLLDKNILWLKQLTQPVSSEDKTFEHIGRLALSLSLSRDNKTINIVNSHLAWASTSIEQPHQREQNIKLIEYIKALEKPWILTGDFNINPDQPSILDLEKVGRNLIREFKIPNTIDPINHVSWNKIQPGFPVDYIFTSPDIEVENFKVLDTEHLSDHFGLRANLVI